MAGFSIDDVRDSFAEDMTHNLAKIDKASQAIASGKGLDVASQLKKSEAHLQAMSEASHTIAGTASLVGATSLANTSRLLEELVAKGQLALHEIELQAARAKRLGEIYKRGAAELRKMVELELAGKQAEATELATAWEGEVLDAEIAQSAELVVNVTANADQEEEFSFSAFEVDLGQAPKSEEDEILDAFRQEAREGLVALQGYLEVLMGDPNHRASVTQVERIFHTLKGAAFAVGLSDVGEQAKALQFKMESVLEGEAPLTPTFVDGIVKQTNAMFDTAGIAQLAPVARRRDDDAVGARRFFADEAKQLLADARELTQQLTTASAKRSVVIRSQLGRMMHRLKGSAALVDSHAVAQAASNLRKLCESQAAGLTHIEHGLAGIEGLLVRMTIPASTGVSRSGSIDTAEKPQIVTRVPPRSTRSTSTNVASAAVRASVNINQDKELFEAFEMECGELFDNIERVLVKLDESDRPRADLEELMRAHHTLKGALYAVELTPVGKVVHHVEDFLERMLEASILPPMRNVANALAKILSGVRKNLRQARDGYVETNAARVEAQLAATFEGKTYSDREPSAETGTPGRARRSSRSSRGEIDADFGMERRFLRIPIERLDSLMNLAGELVVSRSRLVARVDALRSLQNELGRGRKRLIDAVDRFRVQNEFASLESSLAKDDTRKEDDDSEWQSFSDLELDRYDDIHVLSRSLAEIAMDTGEIDSLVHSELTAFGDDSESFSSIVTGIQSEVTRARMVPLETMFTRLRLSARDAAQREGRSVRVRTEGEDVLLDKTMADSLFAPMLHLVRNAIGHGVETSEQRIASGKDPMGHLQLTARQESGQIVIEVSDDGRGLDLAALKKRGVEAGLISPDVADDDPVIAELIFARGISTRSMVGEVSGRGFGGNIVRRAVERLNGTIRVSTKAGQGTTFVMSLPLTLAITRAILVQAHNHTYAVPLYFADRLLLVEEAQTVTSAGVRRVLVDGAYQPLKGLDQLFGHEARGDGPILVLRVGEQRMGLQIDAIIGQEEIVVKGLGEILADHPLFSGMTLRGTGGLALILDVPSLIEAHAGDGKLKSSAVVIETVDTDASLLPGPLGLKAPAAPASTKKTTKGSKRSRTTSRNEPKSSTDASSASGSRSTEDKARDEAKHEAAKAKKAALKAQSKKGTSGSTKVEAPPVPPAKSADGKASAKAPSAAAKPAQDKASAKAAPAKPAPAKPTAKATPAKPTAKAAPPKAEAKTAPAKPTAKAAPPKPGAKAAPPKPAAKAAPPKPGAGAPADKPVAKADAKPGAQAKAKATAAAKRQEPPAVPYTGKLRVLFIDDSVSVRKVAERALKQLNLDVTLAIDGMDALEKLRAGTFDIIFTDLEMPRMNGYDLIRDLRYVPQFKEIPIVVVTSRSGKKHRDQARALGANDYLTKPFTGESLSNAIEALCDWTKGGKK